MQVTWVQSLVREDPTCHGATKPVYHHCWASALEPGSAVFQCIQEAMLCKKRSHPNEKPEYCHCRAVPAPSNQGNAWAATETHAAELKINSKLKCVWLGRREAASELGVPRVCSPVYLALSLWLLHISCFSSTWVLATHSGFSLWCLRVPSLSRSVSLTSDPLLLQFPNIHMCLLASLQIHSFLHLNL